MAPFFITGEVGCYRFLPAFFFPPLAFFAIVCYPPLHVGIETARALPPIIAAAAWHAHSMSAIEQLRVLQAARRPHLRVHADGGETGNRVQLVEVQDLAVAREQKVDTRHA